MNPKYQFAPSFFAGAIYTYTDARFNGPAGNKKPAWHQLGVMGDYLLSKRTDVYAQAVYQMRVDDSTGVTALDNAYIPGANGFSDNAHQVVLRVAMRHTFLTPGSPCNGALKRNKGKPVVVCFFVCE